VVSQLQHRVSVHCTVTGSRIVLDHHGLIDQAAGALAQVATSHEVTTEQLDAASVQGRRFGRQGQTLRFTATGLGTRSDTGPIDTAQATLTLAGSMITT